MSEQDEDYYVPLEDQRVFGAGIKRKRIAFVPATSTEPSTPIAGPPAPTSNVADKYLSIVGLSRASSAPPTSTPPSSSTDSPTTTTTTAPPTLCTVCARPLSPTHESTIAHQVCLTHSHPPSHLDRSRAGVRYLATYGWDPDSRVGLGARADGMRFPIKPVPKHDTVGLHEKMDADSQASQGKVRKSAAVAAQQKREQQGRVVRGDAKQVRKRDDEAKRKAEKLRNLFYANDEVEKYLGDGG